MLVKISILLILNFILQVAHVLFMQDNKYREASTYCSILFKFLFCFSKTISFYFVLVGFYDPIVKKHEDNVRERFFYAKRLY